MILQVSALDQQQEIRHFFCTLTALERGFALLNHIVASGDSLLSATLIDDNQQTRLPVEAFDGVSFLAPLEQLEADWQAILNK